MAYYRRPVQHDAAQAPAVDALQAALPKLTGSSFDFGSSLVSNFLRYGRLSDKQFQWVHTLVEKATAPAPKAAATVNVQAIQSLFDQAGKTLRRVKVKLQTVDGQPVVLTRAGHLSKYAGQILITDGGPFGSNLFFGRIDTDGGFFPTPKASDDVLAVVQDFALDPAGVAGKYGRLTGGCSFCNHGLKDDRSLSVGYGPVCAKNFGLAWG